MSRTAQMIRNRKITSRYLNLGTRPLTLLLLLMSQFERMLPDRYTLVALVRAFLLGLLATHLLQALFAIPVSSTVKKVVAFQDLLLCDAVLADRRRNE